MKTIEELQGFYQATLLPELKTLEVERQRISQNLLIGGLCVGGVFAAIVGIVAVGGIGPNGQVAVILGLVLCIILGFAMRERWKEA